MTPALHALLPAHRTVEVDGVVLAEVYSSVAAEVAATRSRAGLFDLTHHGVLQLLGPDARRWTNGQFTNNVRALPVGRMNQHAMVDDKARIQGLLDLWCVEDQRFLAVLNGVTPEAFSARYERFIIFDDVELTDESAAWALLSVQGPDAAAALGGLPAPTVEGEVASADGVWIARRARTRAGGYDLLVPHDRVAEVAGALGAVPVGFAAQEVLRIEAGYPRWPVDMGEKALPHEMRVVERMCNFEKGCYIGQEVINRIDVMGQVAKKVWGLELAGMPAPHAPVRLAGAEVGWTLSAAVDGEHVRALAILRKAAWTPGAVVQVDGVGDARVVDLPFP